MAQETIQGGERRSERWARVNFPNKFVHPHEYTARDGRVFDKMFVSIPPGVKINGVDVGGYAFDHFAKPREIEQKANGRPVAINFRPGEPVRLFKGIGAERRTLEIANPWDLCRAVKAHNDEYAKVYGTARAETTSGTETRGVIRRCRRPGRRIRHVRRIGRSVLSSGRSGRPDQHGRPDRLGGRDIVMGYVIWSPSNGSICVSRTGSSTRSCSGGVTAGSMNACSRPFRKASSWTAWMSEAIV